MSQDPNRLILLVAVDFSEPSRRAMAWAFDYAQRAPCEVHLFHVVDRHVHLSDILHDGSAERLRVELSGITKAAEDELHTMAPDPDAMAQIGTIYRHIGSGRPAHEIVAQAQKVGADMIVMGTHGHTGLRRALIGSTAEHVVRAAPCTVVCVKPTEE